VTGDLRDRIGATCRYCGKPIQLAERIVNWPWIHASGWYQCVPFGRGTKAEPFLVHEPRCNTYCTPGTHHLASGIGYPHLHRTDLANECGGCVRPGVLRRSEP
jgi:hypothetical protein